MKRLGRTFSFTVLSLILAGGLGWAAQPAGPQTHVILIENMKFSPGVIRVRPGDTVEFKNADLVPHNVTARGARIFDSGPILRNESWKFVAAREGTLSYRCIYHQEMTGTIIVATVAQFSPNAVPAGVELCGSL
jgi:plastocyanin